MSKRFVLADIHGNYKALMQCLERSGFDYEKDTLIQLGDVVDGHSEYLDTIFEDLIKTPGFTYSQIKKKWGTTRFYSTLCANDGFIIEQKIDSITKNLKL